MVCRLLILSMFMLPFQAAQAGMIGTDRVAASAGNVAADRATVLAALDRSDVARQLQSMGVDPQTAKTRVAAMTDQEVQALAGKINSLPAGAYSGWAVAAVIAIIIVIYYAWK
ncbi:MAG: PA2779 family protein [Betaproteobacteria bacterium]|nr:PA2779 family protein [Betaproteobacteria bacterium]